MFDFRNPYSALGMRSERIDYRRDFLEKFQSDDACDFVAVKDAYRRRDEYYGAMKQNVLAEAVSSFRSCGRLSLQARRGGNFEVFQAPTRIARDAQEAHMQRGAASLSNTFAASDLQLKDNVVSLKSNGELFWVTKCEVTGTGEDAKACLEGFSSRGSNLHEVAMRDDILYVHIFAGDYYNRYRCAAELQIGIAPNSKLEEAVLDPRANHAGTYSASTVSFRTDLMSINDEQQRAVEDLRNRIEIIHGPPGTGKSTTIFHVTSARQPQGALSIVTCVTNQAIDAVAEKLAQVHEVEGGQRLLVLGNPERVGATAGQYTLEPLCERDVLVRGMQAFVKTLSRTDASLRKLQSTREAKLWKKHTCSRMTQANILKLQATRKRLEEMEDNHLREMNRLRLESEGSVRRRQQENAYNQERSPANLVQMHIDSINQVKEKIARAAVRAFKLKIPQGHRRLSTVFPRRVGVSSHLSGFAQRFWDVHAFHLKVEAALKLARKGLQVAKDTAPARTVRNTRVLLCTISSTYKVLQLKDDFQDDFPKRLFMGILDEAAATAETYIPLVMRLGIENLVMLGDHRQLSPLVLATGGDRELSEKNIDRSLMERAMDCGVRDHPLRQQYRMPRALCQLVSQLFYGGSLRMGSLDIPNIGGLTLQSSSNALRWRNVMHLEESVGTSKVNAGEVLEIVSLLTSDTTLARAREKVFVITLYKPQATLLRHVLQIALPQKMLQGLVEVITVDAAQGSEAPHIILSTVRNNTSRNIGFAANPRRLCVAISRAQKTFTIVGNQSTLSNDTNWRKVAEGFRLDGTWQDVPESTVRHSDIASVVRRKIEDMAAQCNRAQGKSKSNGKGKNGFKGEGTFRGKGSFGDRRGKGGFKGKSHRFSLNHFMF